MALTGGLAPNGRAALLAMQLWEEDINAKGGLLGRPVKLETTTSPTTIPSAEKNNRCGPSAAAERPF
jgi:branched-chain amino acid transport system substrate-binding protein